MASKKETKITNFIWPTTSNRFVGLIDIVGFKDLVARNSHEGVYKTMIKTVEAVRSSQFTFGIDHDDNEAQELNVVITTYSDSILVYSKNNDKKCQESFLWTIAGLSEDLFKNGIPFKGAVAFGKMTLDVENSIFFGQPLIDAYLLQEELNYYGIVVHSSAEYRRGFTKSDLLMKYPCPFKNGLGKHYTILPATFDPDAFEESNYNMLIKSVNKLGIKTSGHLRKYIDNTLKYLESARHELKIKFEQYDQYQKRLADRNKNDDLPF